MPADAARRPPLAWSLLTRQAHLYVGMIIAPSVLMFAATGALQIFRLQESHPGYTPAPIVEKLGRLHKDQVFAVRPPRPPRAGAPRPRAERAGPTLSKVLLQWFFTFVSVGLFLSTALGVWMGITLGRGRVAARWLLLAGVVIPVALTLI